MLRIKNTFFEQHEGLVKTLADSHMFIDYQESFEEAKEKNSLFTSLSRIIYGSFNHHRMVRLLCIAYLWKNHDKASFRMLFSTCKSYNWAQHCKDLKDGVTNAGEKELVAISEILGTSVYVYSAIKGLELPELWVVKKDSKNVINLLLSDVDRYDPICESKMPKHYSKQQI